MGPLPSRLVDATFGPRLKKERRVLMLGLDKSGKTTILYKIKAQHEDVTSSPDPDPDPDPTIGFNLEEVLDPDIKGVIFTMWDVGGQRKELWKHYYTDMQGLMFIVDSADIDRLSEAKEELFDVVGDPKMRGVPVLVVANKQDLSGAVSGSELVHRMDLAVRMRDRKWHVQETCAKSGAGIREGMRAITLMMTPEKQNKR